jgi:two-component system response regulator DesR
VNPTTFGNVPQIKAIREAFRPPVEEGLVQNTTILLSDDNSAVLEHVGRMLEKERDYKVIGAISDGTAVVREYLRLRPDVIILDISMGAISGIDIAQDLRDSGCRAKMLYE